MKWDVFAFLSIRNKEGRIVIKEEVKCDTYVKNFLLLLNAAFNKSTKSIVDTGGIARAASAKACCSAYHSKSPVWGYSRSCSGPGGWIPNAPATNDSYGIVVGISDTPVSVDDYNLGAKIAHGSGAGQLLYAATTFADPTVDGNKVTQSILRSLTNDSGAGITVKEIGHILKTNSDNYLVMIIRDVITPVNIPAAGSLDVTLKITTTA